MNLLSEAHIFGIYDQGVEVIVRLVHRLADRIEELEALLIRSPQPVIVSLSKDLARAKRTLACQSQELLKQRQLNHQLLRRIRELEHEVERSAPVTRDSHNSSLPPSLDPPSQLTTYLTSLWGHAPAPIGAGTLGIMQQQQRAA